MALRADLRDALFGAFLILVALLVLYGTRNLTFGTPADMGPGFMPRVLAGMAIAFGTVFAVRGFSRQGEPIEPFRLRPLAAVLAAIAAFALLGASAGLLIATFVTAVVAALGSDETRPVEVVVFAIALAAASAALFVKALNLPIPIWPW